jgi:hypothetical protein
MISHATFHFSLLRHYKVYGPWDPNYIEAEIDNWNDDVMLLGVHDGMVLNEDDQWVNPPQSNAERSLVFTLVAQIT